MYRFHQKAIIGYAGLQLYDHIEVANGGGASTPIYPDQHNYSQYTNTAIHVSIVIALGSLYLNHFWDVITFFLGIS